MTDSFSYVERAQTLWASQSGKPLQREGYVKNLSDNLLLGHLSPETEAEFNRADGAELRDAGGRPAKMRALVSSSALAANFFDSWRYIQKDPLTKALKLSESITSLQFEISATRRNILLVHAHRTSTYF